MTATSSDIESSFKSLKRGIMKGKMTRVDSFLPKHIEYLNSEVKLNASKSANSKHTNTNVQMRKRSNSLNECSPIARKRSNSNQFDYYESELDEEENGNNKCLEFYVLVDILNFRKGKKKYESESLFQQFLAMCSSINVNEM